MDRQWHAGAATSPDPQPAEDAVVVALRLRGGSSGPTLLVCGRESLCRPVYRQIMQLPSLAWLSGTLLLGYLGELDAAEPGPHEAAGTERDPFFDDALFLEFAAAEDALQESYRRKAYWTILRKMTAIGMIAGRGVPAS